MGTIYKVRHRLLDEVRVVKVMRPQIGSDEEPKPDSPATRPVVVGVRRPGSSPMNHSRERSRPSRK